MTVEYTLKSYCQVPVTVIFFLLMKYSGMSVYFIVLHVTVDRKNHVFSSWLKVVKFKLHLLMP